MALFSPSESPAIITKEIDLTGVVPNVQTTVGAYVGNFSWGPVEETTLIPNETTLAKTFGAPNTDNTEDFHSAAYFLRYASTLQVVRQIDDSTYNSHDSDASGSSVLVKNEDNFIIQQDALDSDGHTFIGKYPGTIGNSLKVSVLGVDSDDTNFDAWTYKAAFDAPPGTSDYATARSATNDEVHVAVVDEDGSITGVQGAVLETFPFLSLAKGAINADGSTNYIKDVLNNVSNYVWMAGFGSGLFSGQAGTTITSGDDYIDLSGPSGSIDISLVNGTNSSDLGTGEYATGFDLFEDVDNITIDFLIAPGMVSSTDQTAVVNDLVSIAQSLRKDCVVVTSPARSDVIGTNSPVADTVATANTFTKSSYLFMENNYLKVYDKYNDQYIKIPAASSTAGIMAASDLNNAPWFSPGGTRRGQYLGITSVHYSPTKSERDTLYKAGVNPVGNIPGQGVLLYGDKTMLARPSAFDRINVRRLFLAIERSVAIAARNVMFEFNDEFTRSEFVNIIEPALREIQGRRGITDFRVICDETNNTPAVIDRNEFIASIFIKPARSINYVTLNFVAVRTGVDFEEVVGTI